MSGAISHETARRIYDRLGRLLDTQSFYEWRFKEQLAVAGDFAAARSVVELGCGTGTLAAHLLADVLPPDARYVGLDQSETMLRLARKRLAAFAGRAELRRTDGALRTELADGCCDRFVATYVLDLLSEDDIDAALAEAHRLLVPGGRLCVLNLARGDCGVERVVTAIVEAAWRFDARLTAGCRPVAVAERLPASAWSVRHRGRGHAFGIASDVLVAEALKPTI